MNKSTPILASLAALPLIAWSTPAGEVSFHPAEGSSLTKTFSTETEMSLDNMALLINGSPPPMDLGDMEMTIVDSRSVTVTDEYTAMGRGRPAKLQRTYVSLGGTTDVSVDMAMMGGTNENTIESSSDLEGTTVVFTWDEDAGEYTTSFLDDDGDDELLEGLAEDMDIRFLLPEDGTAAEGDTWEVPADALRHLIAPGGRLSLIPEEMEEMGFGGMGQGPQDPADILGDLDGSASCEFSGMRDVDGKQVAVIKVTIEVSTANDMTEKILEQMEDADLPAEVSNMEIQHMDIELEIESEGTLLWDVEAGVLYSLELSGTQTMLMDMAMAMDAEGMGAMELEQSFEMSGNFTLNVTTE